MIAYLEGKILDLELGKVVILTASGVGYEVLINEGAYAKIQGYETIEIYIHHHRTENFQFLFGFVEKEEKNVFEELIKINGVGGKVALNILSIGKNRLIEAVQNGDNKTIEGIKGIGKKGASKIILELQDKDFVKNYMTGTQKSASEKGANNERLSTEKYNDIKATLTTMGYNISDIEKSLNKLPDGVLTVNEIIPFVIKNM